MLWLMKRLLKWRFSKSYVKNYIKICTDFNYASYYEDMGSEDDPFSYIKVIPLIGADAQIKCGGFDHAGKWETSLMMGTYPELVDLSRCERNTEWFAQSATEASEEIGKHMVNCTLEWLRKTIV